MRQTPECPDCRTPMESGVVPDLTYGAIAALKWHPGTPPFDTTFWGRLKDTQGKINYRNCLDVVTYRCTECGLLRSYAQ